MAELESWGRYPRVEQAGHPVLWRSDDPFRDVAQRPLLPYGQGRSYGDACLNQGGGVLETRALDRLISFDAEGGVLRCEAGLTLGALLDFAVPRGFFAPVLPGTQHVSVGGAIANDIHGKNHHRAGSFGRHVRAFELLRSDGSRRVCTPGDALFAATVAGLGLTGLVTWAELQLRRVPGPFLRTETIPFEDLDGFFALTAESDGLFEYTVSWLDTFSPAGRGLFMRGNHTDTPAGARARGASLLRVPFDLPEALLRPATVRLFNEAVHARGVSAAGERVAHFAPFFFPLDAVAGWNRVYGARGFLQFQCVVPERAAAEELLRLVARSGQGSFLSVLKTFGALPSPGMLSFPRPGLTLALDFANRGEETFALLARLEDVTRAAGGALYPAKDARMSPRTFAASFPRLGEFAAHVDPALSSSFWRRVQA